MWYLDDIVFCKSLLIPWGHFNRHILTLFETRDLKEIRILFFISTIRVQYWNQIEKFQNETLVYYYTCWIFCITVNFWCSTFFCINEMFSKLKTSLEAYLF